MLHLRGLFSDPLSGICTDGVLVDKITHGSGKARLHTLYSARFFL